MGTKNYWRLSETVHEELKHTPRLQAVCIFDTGEPAVLGGLVAFNLLGLIILLIIEGDQLGRQSPNPAIRNSS